MKLFARSIFWLPLLLLCTYISHNDWLASAAGWRRSDARDRRDTSSIWQCPERAASTRSSRLLAQLALYTAAAHRDSIIYQTRSGWKETDVDQLITNGFRLDKPTVIYTHGYMQTIKRPWLESIRHNFEQIQTNNQPNKFNLMLYDWSDYAQLAYGSSASYVPYLGKILSQFIGDHLWQRYNYSASHIHIVSYSLSTHIAGQAGRKLRLNDNPLGQITAVDPTGVCFHHDSDFAEKYKLRPSDAKLVVARHYDMGTLGARQPIGGVDIFVNGGSDQPAMSTRGASTALAFISAFGGASSHMRASQHESEPFEPGCQEVAYACKSYEAFMAGECADCGPNGNMCYHVSTLGNLQLGIDPVRKNYKQATRMYLVTGRSKFCLHSYQVLVKMSNQANKADMRAIEASGLSAVVAESSKDGRSISVNPKNKLASDRYVGLLLLNTRPKGFRDNIKVSAKSNLDIKSIESLQINYMSSLSAMERRKRSVRYCPKGSDNLMIKC